MNHNKVSEHVYVIDALYYGKGGVLSTYLVRGETSIVIDPGPTVSIPYVLNELKKLNVNSETLSFLTPTHIHLDHSGGSWRLLENYQNTFVLVHPKGAKHLEEPSRLKAGARALFGDAINNYGEIQGISSKNIKESIDGMILDLGGVTVQIIWTPGHASHHQCFFVQEEKVLIAGDAAGFYFPDTGIIMPTTPPPFNLIKAIKSLDRLLLLEPEKICYGHFGPTTNAMNKLRSHKNQLLLWNRIVKQGLTQNNEAQEIYAEIRDKDQMAAQVENYSSEMNERSSMINLLGFIKYHEWINKNQ
jgi:glyoxylase-like metal-dependent hydrolase (beta-lactamase superfamily II)